MFLLFDRSKTVLPIFRRKKKIFNKLLISNYIFGDCSLKYMEGFCKFKKYIYIDKVLVIFRKWNFAARETGVRVVEIANFLELSS